MVRLPPTLPTAALEELSVTATSEDATAGVPLASVSSTIIELYEPVSARTGFGATISFNFTGWLGLATETIAKSDFRPGEEAVRFALPGVALEANAASA